MSFKKCRQKRHLWIEHSIFVDKLHEQEPTESETENGSAVRPLYVKIPSFFPSKVVSVGEENTNRRLIEFRGESLRTS